MSLEGRKERVLNLAASNYLGLAADAAAKVSSHWRGYPSCAVAQPLTAWFGCLGLLAPPASRAWSVSQLERVARCARMSRCVTRPVRPPARP